MNWKTNAELDAQVIKLDRMPEATEIKSQILPSPGDPMSIARLFVEEKCLHTGIRTFQHWRGGWWNWKKSHWVEVEERVVRSMLYSYTEKAKYFNGKDLLPWLPTRRKISNVIDALAAITILDSEIDQPSWLDGRTTRTIVATANGLLDVKERRLFLHTPLFFNQTSVPFGYLPDAPLPNRWLKFLNELWPQEPDAVKVLGEWFGYVISGRLDLHKLLLMVGPTRGGKGVIARVLTHLIGKTNVCGPTPIQQ